MEDAIREHRPAEVRHICLAAEEFEGALREEWHALDPAAQCTLRRGGWCDVVSDFQPGDGPVPAFALQILPCAVPVVASSIRDWASQLGQALISGLRGHDGPWRGHLFGIWTPGGGAGGRRVALLEDALLDYLRHKQKRLLKTRVRESATPWQADEAFFQAGLLTASEGAWSLCLPEARQIWRRGFSRFPGGRFAVEADRSAPSRAFQKLVEAQAQLGRSLGPDETCVDLGSSPGSWAEVALRQGARVWAVDRSPVRDDLLRNPRLTFVPGDAFRYAPPQPVDWLLSDLIAFPPRIVELVETWLTRRWCRHFIVTLKFKGTPDFAAIRTLHELLARQGAEFQIRHLNANKNEVTAFGSAAPEV